MFNCSPVAASVVPKVTTILLINAPLVTQVKKPCVSNNYETIYWKIFFDDGAGPKIAYTKSLATK